MPRDILVGEIPTIVRGGLYAIPALRGAGILVIAYDAGDHAILFPIVGASACFVMRIVGRRRRRADDVCRTVTPTDKTRLPTAW
jgi:uncharacterized membrane protein YeiH